MLTFSEFIRKEKHSSVQRSKMVDLHKKSIKLQNMDIQPKPHLLSSSSPFYTNFFPFREYDLTYKLERLKLKLIDNEENIKIDFRHISKAGRESKRLAWIFVLLLFTNNQECIKKIIAKDFDINQPIFRISMLPSYFYLSCILGNDRFFKNGDLKYSWNGLPVCLFKKTYNDACLSASSISQYKIMYEMKILYTNIVNNEEYIENETKINHKFEKGIFLVDYMIMNNEKNEVCNIPKHLHMSNFSYLIQNDTKILFMLLKNGHGILQNYKGLTPLHFAAMRGNFEQLAIFLEIGLSNNEKDNFGNTALHYAAMYGNRNCYEYLIKKNFCLIKRKYFMRADENIMNLENQTPLDYKKGDNINENENLGEVEKCFVMYNKLQKEDIIKENKFKTINNRFFNTKLKPTSILEKLKKISFVTFEKEIEYNTFDSYIYIYNLLYKKDINKDDSEIKADVTNEIDGFMHYHNI
ncbi:Ankyrin repeat domain-containing protein 42 [Gurleya vavrai]